MNQRVYGTGIILAEFSKCSTLCRFLTRYYAERGIATASRLCVCLSVTLT